MMEIKIPRSAYDLDGEEVKNNVEFRHSCDYLREFMKDPQIRFQITYRFMEKYAGISPEARIDILIDALFDPKAIQYICLSGDDNRFAHSVIGKAIGFGYPYTALTLQMIDLDQIIPAGQWSVEKVRKTMDVVMIPFLQLTPEDYSI